MNTTAWDIGQLFPSSQYLNLRVPPVGDAKSCRCRGARRPKCPKGEIALVIILSRARATPGSETRRMQSIVRAKFSNHN